MVLDLKTNLGQLRSLIAAFKDCQALIGHQQGVSETFGQIVQEIGTNTMGADVDYEMRDALQRLFEVREGLLESISNVLSATHESLRVEPRPPQNKTLRLQIDGDAMSSDPVGRPVETVEVYFNNAGEPASVYLNFQGYRVKSVL